MSLLLHLQNLSRLASNVDIRRFFYGLDIPPGGVSIIGGVDGDAFITFNGEDQLLRALSLDKQILLGLPVRLYLSKQSDMEEMLTIKEHQKASLQKHNFSGSPKRLNLEEEITSDEESFCGSEVKRRKRDDESPHEKPNQRKPEYELDRHQDELIQDDDSHNNREGRRGRSSSSETDREMYRGGSNHSSDSETSRSESRYSMDRECKEPSIDSDSHSMDMDSYERHDRSRGRSNSPIPNPGFIQACNIPFTATATDIREFFNGHAIAEGGIVMTVNTQDPDTLIAYVKFLCMKDAIKADCICDGFKLHGRNISVNMISQFAFESQLLAKSSKQNAIPPPRLTPVAHSPYAYPPPYGQLPPGPSMMFPPPGYYPPAPPRPLPYVPNHPGSHQELHDNKCSPLKDTFNVKPHLLFNPDAIVRMEYYRIARPQSLSPMASSASKLWAIFGGPHGFCVGVIITHMKSGGPEEAMLAYRIKSERDKAEKCVGANKVKGVRSTCDGKTMLAVLKQLALKNQAMYVSTVSGPDMLIPYQDQQRLARVHIEVYRKSIEPKKSGVVSKALAKPDSKVSYLRFVKLVKDITACEIWGWFDDAKGSSSGVTLVRNEDGDSLFAYVTLHGSVAEQKSFLEEKFQKDRYKICSEHAMLQELKSLSPAYQVLESDESGKDKIVSMYGKDPPTVSATSKPSNPGEIVNSGASPKTSSESVARLKAEVANPDGQTGVPTSPQQGTAFPISAPHSVVKIGTGQSGKVKKVRRASHLVYVN